jgi:cobalt-zinc-cadmium efflux system membrane fusion protein
MPKRTSRLVIIIAVVGAVLVATILRSAPSHTSSEGGESAGPLDYPRGPHGARLLSDEGLQLEMTIYETGVPPQFRIYPYTASRKPIPPAEVELVVELHRLGGRVDRITFTPEADYLRGNATVEEPHSFDVKVAATRNGAQHSWSYSQVEGKVELGPDQVQSAGIVVETAGPRTIQTTLELPGEVKADATRETHVVPQLQGVVLEVLKQEGDLVGKGELMAVLNSRELADAKGQYIEAYHHVEFTRVALEREETLWQKKISAEREYLAAKRDFEEAKLTEDTQAQKLVALGLPLSSLRDIVSEPRERLARFEIRAPLSGTVIERDLTAGEAVRADERIFIVADLSSVWVEVNVYAKDLGAVRTGQFAEVVSSDLGISGRGRINYIGRLVGEETRSATGRLTLANVKGVWRPGLFVTVRIVQEEKLIPIAVSTEGIQTFRDWQVVFVKYGNGFEARPLELGRSDGTWVEVLSGLKVGDQYAGKNSFAVKAEIGKLGATHDH